MTETNISIEARISLFRQRLNTMLETQPVNSNEVLALSELLDLLIADYYSHMKVDFRK